MSVDLWNRICADADVLEAMLKDAREDGGTLKGWVNLAFHFARHG